MRVPLRYAPAPVANPLRGLVPYSGDHGDRFPHTLEFNYLALSSLVAEEDSYDWGMLEALLTAISARGHQAIFRVYGEYPGKKNSIPPYLLKKGLKVHPTESETPDYADPNLRRCLVRFIAALGKKYDGDPRIGFITAGLLGTWGEWHTYPHNELWASKTTQTEVLDAYEAAFKLTPVLLRYPAGEGHYAQAANAHRRFGYHDDSFAWATLETGKKADDWFYIPSLKAAGPKALEKWKTRPIGGEIRPEAWGKVFDPEPGDPQIQSFAHCVEETHVSWLMDTGMFREKPPTARRKRAEAQVRKMGYELHVHAVEVQHERRTVWAGIEVENRGGAPFYYDWPLELGLLDARGKVLQKTVGAGKLTGLVPGDPPRLWQERLEQVPEAKDARWLALRVPNPLENGLPLRFANETQDQHAPGWLTLARL